MPLPVVQQWLDPLVRLLRVGSLLEVWWLQCLGAAGQGLQQNPPAPEHVLDRREKHLLRILCDPTGCR